MAFKAELDDYSAILLESLADRLAEAFAERLHERVRKELWGYAPDEDLDNVGLIKEQYDGIRPAPGYPACPDHTEKALLWELLDVEAATGITLTESMAMWPGAAVSGWYFSHPESQYFVLGRLGPGPGRRLRRAARAGRSRRPSGGSPPTSATSRRTETADAVLRDMDGTRGAPAWPCPESGPLRLLRTRPMRVRAARMVAS